MKDNSVKMILTFLAGLIIGGIIVWYFFCCKKDCSEISSSDDSIKRPKPVLIDTTTAQIYFQNYMLSPDSVNPLKALVINRAQYDAMTAILKADNSVTGFRIYMGATDTTRSVRINMVVGFGTPDHYETIYATDSEESGTCPFICDEKSPITREN